MSPTAWAAPKSQNHLTGNRTAEPVEPYRMHLLYQLRPTLHMTANNYSPSPESTRQGLAGAGEPTYDRPLHLYKHIHAERKNPAKALPMLHPISTCSGSEECADVEIVIIR